MLSLRIRRRAGVVLSALLLFQGLLMPLGACGQTHGGDDGTMEHGAAAHASMEHGGEHMPAGPDCCAAHTGDDGTDGARAPTSHDGAPMGCVALSGCGVSVVNAEGAAELSMPGPVMRAVVRPPSIRPGDVDLGIITPPPRGLPS